MFAGLVSGRRRKLGYGLAFALLATMVAMILAACSQTPTSVPVRTFERAQRMDVACLRLYDPPNAALNEPANAFHPRVPIGRPQNECQPTPSDLDGQSFDKQLFAFVTQTTRGELAVVDLSAGLLVDQSRATPGINFIPVGALPTDVAATPDGKMVFVASAEANKPAIYGIPTRRILGDTVGFPRDPEPSLTLGSWPVCALPQNPGAISVVPRAITPGGGGDGGADAGAAGGPIEQQYDIVVVLPGDRLNSAKVLTLDPRPFRRGGLRRLPNGAPDYASDISAPDSEVATLSEGPVLEPGALQPCSLYQVSAVELVGANVVPSSFVPGPKWEDGVKYVDGGVDLTCKRPAPSEGCGLPPCCGVDGGPPPDPDGGNCVAVDATPDGGVDASVPLPLGPLDPPRLVAMARNEQTVYVADEGAPLIHVLDLSTPSAPRELPPLLATSLADPSRAVRIKDLAISPPTRDYKRFMYAVDAVDGSIIIYDITDPASAQRTPLLRPHPELNPFQPADRVAFNSPVVAVAFARHDVPLARIGTTVSSGAAASGLLCNPNKLVEPPDELTQSKDLGFYYRADRGDTGQSIGPRRLRGIFAFATLATGQVITMNVDDWDSPCRRPVDMSSNVSDVALAEPDLKDTDPYHAPIVTAGAVTNEAFFPMSAPHSLRSEVLITNDTISGNQLPRILSTPQVSSNGVILPQLGNGSDDTPALNVRFSLDEAQVHIDQDWFLVYENVVPGFEGIAAPVVTKNNYASVILDQPQARFCTRGVEDWARGIERTKAVNADLATRGTDPLTKKPYALPAGTERWMTDYVQLTEDLLDVNDGYWSLDQSQGDQACWEGSLATASGATRHDACARTYGSLASDQKPTRDFPIVEAYDDHVVLGRFYTPADGHREVVYTDPSNASDLKLMQCCFHHQVRFRVRTGQQWSAIGQTPGGGGGLGMFSHLTTDSAGRCVASCDTRESLLNARLATLPYGLPVATDVNGVTIPLIDKSAAIAMRNPMYSAVILGAKSNKEPVRDMTYSFTTRGQFRTLTVTLGGASISVNPQSMRYVDSLGQMAVVDGASQGLVLIDLQAVTVARAPYF